MSSTIKALTGLDIQINNQTSLSIDANHNIQLAGGLVAAGSLHAGGSEVNAKWTTATRPANPILGTVGFNTQTHMMEYYSTAGGGQWVNANSAPILSLRYLVIGGGGGSSHYTWGQGGGGAGGFLENSSKLVNMNQTYDIIVGAGAFQGTGQNSYFGSAVAYGGGYINGAGGSGGGGGHSNPAQQGGASIQTDNDGGLGFGFKGGAHRYSNPYPCGGGGGAGAAGEDGAARNAHGRGGIGRISNITGTDVYYAGGGGAGGGSGGGGTGGTGGGGNGVGSGVGGSGTINTGGGAGAGNTGSGTGGSGVVILRLPAADYSGNHTGNPIVTNVGNDVVLQFNSSGTYTV